MPKPGHGQTTVQQNQPQPTTSASSASSSPSSSEPSQSQSSSQSQSQQQQLQPKLQRQATEDVAAEIDILDPRGGVTIPSQIRFVYFSHP